MMFSPRPLKPPARGVLEDRVEVLVREVAAAGHVVAPVLGEAAELVVPSDRAESVGGPFVVHEVVELLGLRMRAAERELGGGRPTFDRCARGEDDDRSGRGQ